MKLSIITILYLSVVSIPSGASAVPPVAQTRDVVPDVAHNIADSTVPDAHLEKRKGCRSGGSRSGGSRGRTGRGSRGPISSTGLGSSLYSMFSGLFSNPSSDTHHPSEPDTPILEKRKGGGGGGGGHGGGGGGGGRTTTGGGGKTTTGGGTTKSNVGGSTTGGSGPKPRYGGGKYYTGGGRIPFTSGSNSPVSKLKPIMFSLIAIGFLYGGIWAYDVWRYSWGKPIPYTSYRSQNSTLPSNMTEPANGTLVPVVCLCEMYSECGCEEEHDDAYIQGLLKDATSDAGDKTAAWMVYKPGDPVLVINGTLPNGTTADDQKSLGIAMALGASTAWALFTAGAAGAMLAVL